MEAFSSSCCPKKSHIENESGVALITAIIICLAVMMLIISTAYFITQTTLMSGAGKRYASSSEAADGAVEVMKDAVRLIFMGENFAMLPIQDNPSPCLVDALFTENTPCTASLALPGTGLFSHYKAEVTITRLYTVPIPGTRMEFARSANVIPLTAIYFRINAIVSGNSATRAETTTLYRFTQ